MSRTSLVERVAKLEVTINDLRDDLKEHLTSFKDFKKFVYKGFDDFEERFSSLDSRLTTIETRIRDIRENLNPKMSGKDKAAIIIAVVTSLSSIIVALITALSR